MGFVAVTVISCSNYQHADKCSCCHHKRAYGKRVCVCAQTCLVMDVGEMCCDASQSLYVVLVLSSNFAVFRPIIRQLDMAMKRNRSMLLLFPEEVVHSVTAIATLMKEYAKSAARSS